MKEPGDERVETALIATGGMARAREQARHQVQQGEARRIKRGVDATAETTDAAFLQSSHFATEEEVLALQQRPAVDFTVLNAGKSDTSSPAARARPHRPIAKTEAKRPHPWFSPVHIPLAHRKLVESPPIFDGITPTATQPTRSRNQTCGTPSFGALVPRVAALSRPQDRASGAPRKRRPTVDRNFIESLRARNKELYDSLAVKFQKTRRFCQQDKTELDSRSETGTQPLPTRDIDPRSDITSVEDALLFFLHEKHAHDVLYFKRRSDAHGSEQPRGSGSLSLSLLANTSAVSSRFMPYDLERVSEPGKGDFFIMSSSALVHHTRSEIAVLGEVIPIGQWIVETKMFSLLLAGIPLFQKFLVRKVFVRWALKTRHRIFVDLKNQVGRTFPLGRQSFVRPLLASRQLLRRVQDLRALSLPAKHPAAIQLCALHEHHRNRLSEAETDLIDAKEELLQLMDKMVQDIHLLTDPSTQLDDLYSAAATEVHTIDPKWKSAPIKVLKHRKHSLANQINTAKTDMSLVDNYVRLMEYMYSESIYLMILGSVRHIADELRRDDNYGSISASVAIVGDELILSPSANETKDVFLEGIARLVRLAGNFHFTKNAVTWSMNRGTGSLGLVSSAFASETITTQFDLQMVLRHDTEFKIVSSHLIQEVSNCFDEAAHQMKAFESLKPIYAAVQSVSRAETRRNLDASGVNLLVDRVAELSSVIGVSGSDVAKYLRTLSHRLSVLDRSQHACQKIQSSWKVRFLEIQCRRSVTEILELIAQERYTLHQHVLELSSQGTNACLSTIQSACLVIEDRPQLIEYFCEQLKQVKALQDKEKQLHQDIRNVDEIVRTLKRHAPDLMSDGSIQYNLLHAMYNRYSQLMQSHSKFASKMLPSITLQVNNALQRYDSRCQRLLRLFKDNAGLSTEEELEKQIGMFQDITREIRSIEEATQLYHTYQKIVGTKVTEITMLAEARSHWDEVQDVVSLVVQWKAATHLMEGGIFSDQPWLDHLEKVEGFLSRVRVMRCSGARTFALKLLDRLEGVMSDYRRRLDIVVDMAKPYVKPHHWQQILALLDIVNYVSSTGVALSDGSTLTLGFLQSRSLWKFENQIRDIALMARNDSVTEGIIDNMKRRIYAVVLPITIMDDVYELKAAGMVDLLANFDDDLVTVQALAQLTSNSQLSVSLTVWAEEISYYQHVLELWANVQADWKKLGLIFGNLDVQQIVVETTYEFQALDRKWRTVMVAAKASSSLPVCLREVMSRAFLDSCSLTMEKLWRQLGNCLSEKRHSFPRLYFISDRDLLHVIASSKYPVRLNRLISKCFNEVGFLQISRGDVINREQHSILTHCVPSSVHRTCLAECGIDEGEDIQVQHFEVEGIVGRSGEHVSVKALRVSANPEIWMRDLDNRIVDTMKETLCMSIDGPLASCYEENFFRLTKAEHIGGISSTWSSLPLVTLLVCVKVMITNELTSLVWANRNETEWKNFWSNFEVKKENLVASVQRQDLLSRERLMIEGLLILLMNSLDGIQDLFREDPGIVGAQSLQPHHPDTTSIHYNYAYGSSFCWTKLMRFHYDPFDKKCVVHQSVRTYEYGNSFISGYPCPVLTPLSDRIVFAINLATSLEVGACLYSTGTSLAGKQTLLKNFATSIGVELLSFHSGTAISLPHLYRLIVGALQSDTCWIVLRGLESQPNMSMLHVISEQMNRLTDAIRSGHETVPIDGTQYTISNSQIGIFVCASLNPRTSRDHQELLLRLSHTLMPILCQRPQMSRIAQSLLIASGIKDASTLSRKLDTFVNLADNSSAPFLGVRISLDHVRSIIHRAASRLRAHPWKSEERCLILALWDELGITALPDHRVLLLNYIRSIFPIAEELELSSVGLLATRTANIEIGGAPARGNGMITGDDGLAYDSDDELTLSNLSSVRDSARLIMEECYRFAVSDQYLRKLIDFYQVVNRNVMTIIVGPSGTGKTTAVNILSRVFGTKRVIKGNKTTVPTKEVGSQASSAVVNSTRVTRLFISAFSYADVYGCFREDESWDDGLLTRFIRKHCDLANVYLRAQNPVMTEPPAYSGEDGIRSLTGSHPPWLLLDGLPDLSALLSFREILQMPHHECKLLRLPNGDQLHLSNHSLRLFCEVMDLSEWCPSTISRCGVLHFPGDILPYTVLVKSWVRQLTTEKPHYTRLASVMGKFARSILPQLLEVCKRHIHSFTEVLVLHQVANCLSLLSFYIDKMAPDSKNAAADSQPQAKIIVGYATLLSLGLCIQGRGRREFHECVISLVPELANELRRKTVCGNLTIYDANLMVDGEIIHLELFETLLSAFCDSRSTRYRRDPNCQYMSRRLSDMSNGTGGMNTCSSIFFPTPRLLGYRVWIKSLLRAKLSVLVVGDSAVGKTKALEDVVSDLSISDQIDSKFIQINKSVRSEDVLKMLESGLPRRMRGVFCPSPGKKAVVVVIENLNLEEKVAQRSGLGVSSCSEMIRQVRDAGGSYVKSTKEFVEFRDLLIASSFSRSSYGYPCLSSRLMRHFNLVRMADESGSVCRVIAAKFSEQLTLHLPSTLQMSEIARICSFSIETYHSVRKKFRPSRTSPQLLFSVNDVIHCLERLLNVSTKSAESITALEKYTVHTTFQHFRCRMTDADDALELKRAIISTGKRLGYSMTSLGVVNNPYEHFYADYGDNAGCVCITSRAAAAMFVAADERFQWYNRRSPTDTTTHDSNFLVSQHSSGFDVPVGISPLAMMRKFSDVDESDIERERLQISSVPSVDETQQGNSRRAPLPFQTFQRRPQYTEKSTAVSPATIQNMLDVLGFLQSGARRLFFCGAEPSKRRCAAMIACGAQAFHFREISSQFRMSDFVDHLKVSIMEAGLKASYSLIYVDCDSLTQAEMGILIEVMIQSDLPNQFYSSADKAKILAYEHQLRSFQQSHFRRPSVSSFFDDLTAVTSTRDGMIGSRSAQGDKQLAYAQRSANSQTKSVYHDNLRRCLCVVLSFGSCAKMYDLLSSYPTLYYQACVKTFQWFDRESLGAVYTDTLTDVPALNDTLARISFATEEFHDLEALAIAIHEDAMKILRSADNTLIPDELGRRFCSVRSRFEDFLGHLKLLYLYQKDKVSRLQDALLCGIRLLEGDGKEAADQLEKSADGYVQLTEASRAVLESATKLREHEAIDRDARRAFLLDEQRCASLHGEVERERDMIQSELDKTLPDVAKATDALSQINKHHITEMKSFVNPPQLVRLAMQAVCVLLGVPPTWTEALRILADIHFLDRLRNFNKDRIDVALIDRVKLYTNHPDFSMENMKRASVASTTLCKWVLSLVKYFEVMKRVAPTRRKLIQTEHQFQQIDEMVRGEHQKIIDLELYLNELRVKHLENVRREEELQQEYESKTKWKAGIIQFQGVVERWLVVLNRRAVRVSDQHFKLIGDSAIAAAAATYLSHIRFDAREGTMLRWQNLALRHLRGRPSYASPPTQSVSTPGIQSFAKSWSVSSQLLKEALKRIIVLMELKDEVPFTLNMLLMDQVQHVAGRYPILIDPLSLATSWLRRHCDSISSEYGELNEGTEENIDLEKTPGFAEDEIFPHQVHHTSTSLLKQRFRLVLVDACESKAVELIEKQINCKSPLVIVITHASDCDEATFHALLDVVSVATKKGGHTIIFSTKALGKMLSWKPQIWSQLSAIDCTPTAKEIENYVLSKFLRHYWPALEADYDAACDAFVAERSNEEQVICSFVEYLQKLSDDRQATVFSYARQPSRVGVVGSSIGQGDHLGLDENEMGTITRFLSEYTVARHKRQRAKRNALELRQRRQRFEPIAYRAHVFLTVEEHFFSVFPRWQHSLKRGPESILVLFESCIKEVIASVTGTTEDGPDNARVQSVLQSMVDSITERFLLRRLLGIPSVAHRSYLYLLAVSVASAKGERGIAERLLPLNPTERSPNFQMLKAKSTNAGMDRFTELARSIATEFVHAVISSTVNQLSGWIETAVAVPSRCQSLYYRIHSGLLCLLPPRRRRQLETSLSLDMERNGDAWVDFAQSPSLDQVNDANAHSGPLEWFRQLNSLESCCLSGVLFCTVSPDIVDAVINDYIGRESARRTVTKNLLETPCHLGIATVVHFDPHMQALSPISLIAHSARLAGLREEYVLHISLKNEGDVRKLGLLREQYPQGIWFVVHDTFAASQVELNALRLEMAKLDDMQNPGSVCGSRLWILHPLVSGMTPSRLDFACNHLFLEHPSRLVECYEESLRDEIMRKFELDTGLLDARSSAAIRLGSQRGDLRPLKVLASNGIRHGPIFRSQFSPQLPNDQLWMRSGLWIFQSMLRAHLSLGKGDAGGGPTQTCPIPPDLLACRIDMQRIMRAIQLHHRQRTLASTMVAILGLSGSSLTAYALAAESTCVAELASAVYSSKIPHPTASGLIRDLLRVCLHTPGSEYEGGSSGWSQATEWERQLVTARDLISVRDPSELFSSLADESAMLPKSLRTQIQASSCPVGISVTSVGGSNTPRFTQLVDLIAIARTQITRIIARLPPRECLAGGIHRQEHHRRASIITAWRKYRPTALAPLGTHVKHSASSPCWERAVLDHLLQTELPAIEAYVRHLWALVEFLSSLKMDYVSGRADAMGQELGSTLETLSQGRVPQSWRKVSPGGYSSHFSASSRFRDGPMYPAPVCLDAWIGWVQRTVEYYQRVANERQLPEILSLSSFGYPRDCLVAVHRSIAIDRGISMDLLSFVIRHPGSSLEGGTNESVSSDNFKGVITTFQVSDLMLWNACWSAEAHALTESVTHAGSTRRILEPLPTLTVQVVRGVATTDTSHLYRCPVFLSAASFAQAEEPIAFLFSPTVGPASALSACGVAMFIQEDLDDGHGYTFGSWNTV